MLFLFDKLENLSGIVPKEQVKAAHQTQNLNAAYTLTSTVNQSVDITSALYVAHRDVLNEKSIHLYRIIGTEWADKGITIDGIESAYDDLLADGFIKDQRPTNKSVSEVLTNILAGSRWSVGIVDTSRTVTANFYYISRLEALRKMVESADCEIRPRITFDGSKITGRYIDVVDRLGEDRGKRFVHGSNLLQVIKTDNSAELYTALVGRGKGLPVIDEDGEETGGYGRKIGFADIAWSVANGDPVDKPLGQEWVEIPELTAAFGYPDGRPRIGHADFPEEEDEENLLKRTHDMALFTGRPKVSYRTAVRDIGDTGTGDTVTIIRDDLGIRYKTRIYKRVINLMKPDDTVIELGDLMPKYNAKKFDDIKKKIEITKTESEVNSDAIIENQTTLKSLISENTDSILIIEADHLILSNTITSVTDDVGTLNSKVTNIEAGKITLSSTYTNIDSSGKPLGDVIEDVASNKNGLTIIEAGMAEFTTKSGGATYIKGGSIDTSTLNAQSGKIGGWSLTEARIQYKPSASTNQNAFVFNANPSATQRIAAYNGIGNGSLMFGVGSDGSLYAMDANIKGKVTATEGSFTGSIYAGGGTIGGYSIYSTYLGGGNVKLEKNQITVNGVTFSVGSFNSGTVSISGVLSGPSGILYTRNIWPTSNNSYTLGTTSLKWKQLYTTAVMSTDVSATNIYYDNLYQNSDIRLKENVVEISDSILDYIETEVQAKTFDQGGKKRYGYIAQDVERAFYKHCLATEGYEKAKSIADRIDTYKKPSAGEGMMSLSYIEVLVLKEAELQRKIKRLETRVVALEGARSGS